MSALADHLRRRIGAQGPLPLSVFMAEALGHPRWGYYTGRDPLGADGDFTTSPEISQMFGELLGLWCAQVWLDQGRPGMADASLVLAELGPGRGTLMADALRALGRVPGLRDAATVCLVEISPVLRQRQERALAPALAAGWRVRWCDDVGQLPEGPLLLLANEFFDALPIRQLVRTPQGWSERLVGLADAEGGTDGADAAFAWMAGPARGLEALVPLASRGAPPGAVVELCPAGAAIAAEIAARLTAHGGGALVVDYGYAGPAVGDTLQALSRHRFVPPLDRPGEVDLTAHVDFTALGVAAAGAAVYGPIGQGPLLTALGLGARAARLAAGATPGQAAAIADAARRLTADDSVTAMGRLFQALAILPPTAPPPPGFPLPEPATGPQTGPEIHP